MSLIYSPDFFPRKRPKYYTKERDEFLLANPKVDTAILAYHLGLAESFIITYQRKLGIRRLTSNKPGKGRWGGKLPKKPNNAITPAT
jgi:hypothetical protein